jgi:hypothetical protein
MKWMGVLLACYLILLSAIPCCAIDDCPDIKTEQNATHKNDKENAGNCSPFFNCQSGCTASIVTPIVQIGISPVKSNSVFTVYAESSLTSISHDFWQPPRVMNE